MYIYYHILGITGYSTIKKRINSPVWEPVIWRDFDLHISHLYTMMIIIFIVYIDQQKWNRLEMVEELKRPSLIMGKTRYDSLSGSSVVRHGHRLCVLKRSNDVSKSPSFFL